MHSPKITQQVPRCRRCNPSGGPYLRRNCNRPNCMHASSIQHDASFQPNASSIQYDESFQPDASSIQPDASSQLDVQGDLTFPPEWSNEERMRILCELTSYFATAFSSYQNEQQSINYISASDHPGIALNIPPSALNAVRNEETNAPVPEATIGFV